MIITNTCQGSGGTHYTIYLEYIVNSQDISQNKSNITIHLYAQSDSTSYQAYSSDQINPVKIIINGEIKFQRNQGMDFRDKKIVDMGSWTGDVVHNSDGNLTLAIAGNFEIKGTSSLSRWKYSNRLAIT